jgi:hypothetical protein
MTVFVYLNDVEDGGRTQWRWTTGKKTVSFPTFDSQMIILTKTGSGQTQGKLKNRPSSRRRSFFLRRAKANRLYKGTGNKRDCSVYFRIAQ